MKPKVRSLPIAALLAIVPAAFFLSAPALRAENEPVGYVDFGTFVPGNEGRFVDINLPEGLLKFAALLTAKEEPQAADIIRNLKRVRVNVVELNDANRAATLERVSTIRQKLEAQGWTPFVNVREDAKGEDVRIYARTHGENVIDGLVVTVIEGHRQVVLVNIVGDIKPEQIAMLADRFNIEPLKKLEHVRAKAS